MARNAKVSLLLATAGRPEWLRIVMRAIVEQDYEGDVQTLLLIDEPACLVGVVPRNAEVVATGKINLGAKLALGLAISGGDVVMKLDDDDWYGPRYISRMVHGLGNGPLAFVQPFRFFDLPSWTIVRAGASRCSGATITFRRDALAGIRFRDVRDQVDAHFLTDALRAGIRGIAINVGSDFLQCRHAGTDAHLWTHMPDGESVEEYIARRPAVDTPESVLPGWALEAFRCLRGGSAV